MPSDILVAEVVRVEERPEDRSYFRVSATRRPEKRRPKWLIILFALVCIGVICWVAINYEGFETETVVLPELQYTEIVQIVEDTPIPTVSPTFALVLPTIQNTPSPIPYRDVPLGTIVYAARNGGNSHLWFYIPGDPEPFQLTYGDWDDRHPSIAPNGNHIAFSSHRDGNWDLYLFDITTGETRRLTATLGYEGRPHWSPDGQWLTYEAYYEGNYDVWLMPVEGSGEPIRLTTHPAEDLSPVWSPDGRKIVFTSNRDGNFDLYLADLDAVEDRFQNISHTTDCIERDPVFAVDGQNLAYSSRVNSIDQLMVMDISNLEDKPRIVGQGVYPAWSPGGDAIAAVQQHAHNSSVVGYSPGQTAVPPVGLVIEGMVSGLDWFSGEDLLGSSFSLGGASPSEWIYEIIIETPPVEGGRFSLINLPGVSAPRPFLSDKVNEAFVKLQERLILEVGWDFLANLDYAFVGLNDPLPPGYAYNDWLFTGRAFAISEAIVRAGWVEIFREDIAGDTYWRIYVRSRYQDGSLGEPLRGYPWKFDPRFGEDPDAYDKGGSYREVIPEGYYVDFTSLAADYGFYRQPALSNWRTYYAGTRYAEFAYTDGLTWEEAMLELYPPAAIITPTPFRTPTPTPTRTPWPTVTPWWIQWHTETPTATWTPFITPTQLP
jgi:TolB protein